MSDNNPRGGRWRGRGRFSRHNGGRNPRNNDEHGNQDNWRASREQLNQGERSSNQDDFEANRRPPSDRSSHSSYRQRQYRGTQDNENCNQGASGSNADQDGRQRDFGGNWRHTRDRSNDSSSRPRQHRRTQGNERGNQNASGSNADGQRNDQNNQRKKFNPFTYHNLKKFATDYNNNELVNVFANSEYDLEGFINTFIEFNFFEFFIKIIAKMCHSDYDESKIKVLTQLCDSSSFVSSFMTQIIQAPPQKCENIALDIITFFETVTKIMPDLATDKLSTPVEGCFLVCQGKNLNQGILDNLSQILTTLAAHKEEKKVQAEKKKTNRFERLNKMQPPNDFREMSIYPTSEDVLTRNDLVFLRPNLVSGKYDDIDHYLDVQFRLLREDFIRPLREGIEAFISGEKDKLRFSSVRVYEGVKFLRNDDKLIKKNPKRKDVEGQVVHFDPKKKYNKIDWEHNRRFMYGSLLCFSRDKFNSLLISTVSDRDIKLLEDGMLRVVFSHELQENIYQHTYTMVESEVFFDPYYHVLKTLQTLKPETFPLPEYIVSVQEDEFPPAYLEPKSEFDPPARYFIPLEDGSEVPIICTDSHTWPSPKMLGLDASQYLALHAALTRELVVIQGPPGTGKTFMGSKITNILINNKAQTGRTTPILVVCLTNHALDQFLIRISDATKKIVRIGGQSKCPEMEEYNLRVLKRQTKSRDQMKLIYNVNEEIRRVQLQIKEYDSIITALRGKIGVVSFDVLHEADVVSVEAARALKSGRFLNWLLDDSFDDVHKNEDQTVSHIKFDILLENFDKQIEELEIKKIDPSIDINLSAINYEQNELQRCREWLSGCLASEELATPKQVDSWTDKIWKLSIYQKWQLYNYWMRELENKYLEEVRKMENDLLKLNNKLSDLRLVDDLEVLRESDVVGMTTTGAARLHKLLRKLGPEIVIVEEAAEVLEAHVVACLTDRCNHLILIGDHKQLRPQIATYELERKYHFDISLFERMVMNRGNCITLEKQHRMAPAISKLITPSIYDKLENSSEVYNYPEIPGIPNRLFFIDHTEEEEMLDKDSSSRINRHEANFLLCLCRHLVYQGIKAEKITILTTYKGQMFHIRKAVKTPEYKDRLHGVLVQVVDNYQGEENDIILLSLVRSNKECHTGFLKTENRVCVALSRAKHALYIVGNMSCLIGDTKVPADKNIWNKMNATLKQQGVIGPGLTLRCIVHPEIRCTVSTGKDFTLKCPQGGCTQLCTSMLLCGHECRQVCHTLNRNHEGVKCQSPCDLLCSALLHKCTKLCYQDCGECKVSVTKTLSCGHEAKTKCHVRRSTIKCKIEVEKTFQPCGHKANVECYVDPRSPCPFDCDSRLDCGHSCILKCHVTNDPDHLQYVCKKPCGKKNAGCSMNHECGKLCYEPCSTCIKKINKKRSCGHTHHIPCSEDPERVQCKNKCTQTLECGHKCLKLCYVNCEPCSVMVKKQSPCGHTIDVECGLEPSKDRCNNVCKLELPCGHNCEAACNKPCITQCKALVSQVVGVCGHKVQLQCWEQQRGFNKPTSSDRCPEKCPAVLNCGHLCPGTCGTCVQTRFHELCDKPCNRVLVCGHLCKQPCASMCPPCEEKCPYICCHNRCNKKCGEPCTSCKERCTWRCAHKQCKRRCGEPCDRDPCNEPCPKKLKCGHECISFCGEPCPADCRVCNKEKVTEIFFGSEDEPTARFVHLVDCGHNVEVEGMEQWMSQNADVVGTKKCPICSTGIKSSFRFGNSIKESFNDILKVKNKNFGNPKLIEETRQALVKTLQKLITELEPQSAITSALGRVFGGTTRLTPYDKLLLALKATEESLAPVINMRQNVQNSVSIRCREIEVDILSRLCEVWRKTEVLAANYREQLKPIIELILDNLDEKKRRLSQQQVIDFNLEILRLQRTTEYLSIKSLISGFNASILAKKVEQLIDGAHRFSEKKSEDVIQHIRAIKIASCIPGLGITEFERKEIVEAMKLTQGHWFMCPNKHPYAIGECGGAMQLSKCPECSAPIGGQSHRLTTGNSHFGVMDGSSHAAWNP